MAQSLESDAARAHGAGGSSAPAAEPASAVWQPWRLTRAAPRKPAADVPWITGIRLFPGGDGRLINISSVGCLVGSQTRLVPGTEVVVRFAGLVVQQPLKAAIVRSEVASIDRSGKVSYRSGIAFAGTLDLVPPDDGTRERRTAPGAVAPEAGRRQGPPPEPSASRAGQTAVAAAVEPRSPERDQLEARCLAAEARCRELAERYAAERSEWEDTLRGAEERLGRLATEQAEQRVALERALLEAQLEHERRMEQYAADAAQWEQAQRSAEERCQALLEERQSCEAAWQARVVEVEGRYESLLEQARSACADLASEHRQSRERFDRAAEEHQTARAEWDRSLQEATVRHEAAAADARAECERLRAALDDSHARYRDFHSRLMTVLQDVDPAADQS